MTSIRPRKTISTVKPATTPAAAKATPKKVAALGHVFALDVPFEARSIATGAGAKWDAERKVFLYRGDTLPETLRPYAAVPYSLEAYIEDTLNETPRAPSPDLGTITPRAHQREAIDAIVAARQKELPGFLLADDVGLGKTISAWGGIIQDEDADSVLIVCPLAVVAHWRRTITAMGDGGRSIIVMNYERLGKLFTLPPTPPPKRGKKTKPRKVKKVKTAKGLARRGAAMAFDVIVWDESHRLKNPTTARSKFAAKLNDAAEFCLWLSATAGQNPLELNYLSSILAATTGEKTTGLKDFEGWCLSHDLGVTRGAYGRWDWRGEAADCDKVHALLFDAGKAGTRLAIRRRPEDIAGWPELNRILTPIGLEGEARAPYQQLWTAFRKEMDLAPAGKDPRGALAATLRLRQKGSLIRVPGTVELALELLENGHQVAISVAFLETLTALQEALDAELGERTCATIHGRLSATEREDERLRFQRGGARVCLFTVEEGISLHQGEHNDVPRSEIIHDLRWSAIQMAQIEGRCHRDGRFAQAYWVFADDTIEERIAGVVCRRILAMKQMIGDDTETLQEIDGLLRQGADL